MNTAALIIATGKTTQRDSFEPQREIGTLPAIARVVKVFRRACIERIVVVCDRTDNKTEKLATRMNAVFLHCPKDMEMMDGIKIGLMHLPERYSSVLITHTDIPLFSVETVRLLMRTEKSIGIPAFNGHTGHPVFIKAKLFPSLISYSGNEGLAGAIRDCKAEVQIIEVQDEGVLVDIQRDQDYERLIACNSLTTLHPEIQIRLAGEKAFYGSGAHQLLKMTEETSSLSEACWQMGLSTAKGRAIVTLIEQQLGVSIMTGQVGGRGGGGSTVTAEGKELMRKYEAFCDEAKQSTHKLFKKHFGDTSAPK